MKIVPKPEGFDLRDRRSSKSNDAKQWLGHDALFAASEVMPKDTKTCAVVWQEETPKGVNTVYRLAGESNAVIAALTQALHDRLG